MDFALDVIKVSTREADRVEDSLIFMVWNHSLCLLCQNFFFVGLFMVSETTHAR